MLLEDVLTEFLLDCQLRQWSERTIKHERNSCCHLFKYLETTFGVTDVEKVKPVHLKGYIKYLTELGRKETYVNSLIHTHRAFFKYCVQEEYITSNPCERIPFQKEETTMILTFTDDEVERMVCYYKGNRFLTMRNKLIIILLFDTGIRNSELCNIQMSDIRQNAININGKGKKQRYVPITAAISKWLIKYTIVREHYIRDKHGYQEDYLFLSQKGKPLTKETVERVVGDCKEPCKIRTEIRCSPHTCRHYYAQKQLKNGCDVYSLSRLLGHNDISTTKRYLQSISDEDILDIATKTSPLSRIRIK